MASASPLEKAALPATDPPVADLPQQSVFWIQSGGGRPADDLLAVVGNKAFNLMRLTALGLPVPPGFVLGTGYCRSYLDGGRRRLAGLGELLANHVRRLENLTGRCFGDERRPLLVSVRSGAAASMPGMMQTMLNIGLTDRTVAGLVRLTGNPRLAWDSYRRLVQLFGETVDSRCRQSFEAATADALNAAGADSVAALNTLAIRALTHSQLRLYEDLIGRPFPQTPMEQLELAVEAVFRSWESPSATEYRRLNGLDGLAGTAVTVQSMVFGNAGATSGSGVGFTRNPATGEKRPYIEFLRNVQGEDIVSGRHAVGDDTELRRTMPDIHDRLLDIARRLEAEFKDVQEFEFTVEDGHLFLLQARTAKRTAWAQLRTAVDMVGEGLIPRDVALARLRSLDLTAISRQHLDIGAGEEPLAHAVAASVGVASGRIALSPEEVKRFADRGEPAILVRDDIATADIAGMAIAAGILTARGGRTSHAAVVARQLDRVCVVGCTGLAIDGDHRTCVIGGRALRAGDWLTLDGNSGTVYAGRIPVVIETPDEALRTIARWQADMDRGHTDPAPARGTNPS